MAYKDTISGISIHIKRKEQLPYGNGSRGRLVPSEKGRRAIFVPSFGALEKEEVDYVVEAAQEQEDERIKKNETSIAKQRLEAVATAMLQAPAGQRRRTGEEIIKEIGG